jgi:hypothetical protein
MASIIGVTAEAPGASSGASASLVREARADYHPPQIFLCVLESKHKARYDGLTLINAATCMTIEAAANFSRNNGVTVFKFGPRALFGQPGRFLVHQFGLPNGLFLGIVSTSSGSARSISMRAIRNIGVAVVRPRPSAAVAVYRPFGLSLSKVRDEKSHIRCGVAQQARRSVERNA